MSAAAFYPTAMTTTRSAHEPDDLPRSRFVMRREEVALREDARGIIANAHHHAEAIHQEAQRIAEQEIQRGHAEGVREGRAEAARLLAEAATTVDAFFDAREKEMTDLAFAIAYRLIGQFPADEQMARVAKAALAEHRSAVKITLRVSPGAAADLRKAVAGFDPNGRVEVEADEMAPPGSCTLVHDRGRASIGLLDQFRALMDGVRNTK